MRTIVEPKEHIDKLWGKQGIHEGAKYRLMKYVLRVDHDDRVLLHNVVTGRLVVLDEAEAEALEKLPKAYSSEMEQLVTEHYLVPEDYDEHQQVIKLRVILRRIADGRPKRIIGYTILPTTACNARCYYCFEQDIKPVTMSEGTANELVEFITNHCGEPKQAFITWFGGEPTVAENRIDQISNGLHRNKVKFRAKMVTNGYLFDDKMVAKAKKLWNLQSVQITVDGTEKSYNAIKAYIAPKENPYQRVMRNIGLMLDNGIGVVLRMNFDIRNQHEFNDLLNEVACRFGNHKLLMVVAHPVIGEYKDQDGITAHGSDEWFANKLVEFSNLVRQKGLQTYERPLPFVRFEGCMASNPLGAVITVEGGIVRCPEQFGISEWTGDVRTGVVNQELVESWRKVADYPTCAKCELYPECVRLVQCSNTTYCHKAGEILLQHKETICSLYESYEHNSANH